MKILEPNAIRPSTAGLELAIATFLLLSGCAGGGAIEPTAEPAVSEDVSAQQPDWAALATRRLPMLERCDLPHVDEEALCGALEVPEDRSIENGRMIGLKVIVVPATVGNPPADPVFVFEGGPGGAATGRAVGSTFAGPVRRRDIVLVDQRGTGGSNKLACDLGGGAGETPGNLRAIFPPDDVRACARELSESADLFRYTSADHADDIEEVRRWLGYGPINIRGGSYGTWAMMVFAQRYPEGTRSLFGIGVDSPLRSNLAERGVLAGRALAGVAELCREEERCAAIAGSLESTLARLLAGLEGEPRRVELADPAAAGEKLVLDVGRDWLAEKLRLIVYYAFTSRALPWAVHRADAADDWAPLVQLAVLIERSFRSALADGVVLTVQCSEMMDFDIEAARERGSKSLFGNYRLEQQIQGCSAWPHRRANPLGAGQRQILETPALFLSGALDAVTPPEYAQEARELFPNSLHIVLPKGQHGPFDLENSWECVHRIWAEFLDAGSVEGLDTSCVEEMRRPPFLVDGDEFDRYLREVLVEM